MVGGSISFFQIEDVLSWFHVHVGGRIRKVRFKVHFNENFYLLNILRSASMPVI